MTFVQGHVTVMLISHPSFPSVSAVILVQLHPHGQQIVSCFGQMLHDRLSSLSDAYFDT